MTAEGPKKGSDKQGPPYKDPEAFAKALKEHNIARLKTLKIEDFARAHKDKYGPNLQLMANDVKVIPHKVRDEILLATSKAEQQKIFNYYLQVIDESVKIQDLASAYLIFQGLTLPPIGNRLNYLSEGKQNEELLSQFNELFDPEKNFKNLRDHMQSIKGIRIPVLPILFRDITLINEGNQLSEFDIENEVIEKLIKSEEEVKEIIDFEIVGALKRSIETAEPLKKELEALNKQKSKISDDAYLISKINNLKKHYDPHIQIQTQLKVTILDKIKSNKEKVQSLYEKKNKLDDLLKKMDNDDKKEELLAVNKEIALLTPAEKKLYEIAEYAEERKNDIGGLTQFGQKKIKELVYEVVDVTKQIGSIARHEPKVQETIVNWLESDVLSEKIAYNRSLDIFPRPVEGEKPKEPFQDVKIPIQQVLHSNKVLLYDKFFEILRTRENYIPPLKAIDLKELSSGQAKQFKNICKELGFELDHEDKETYSISEENAKFLEKKLMELKTYKPEGDKAPQAEKTVQPETVKTATTTQQTSTPQSVQTQPSEQKPSRQQPIQQTEQKPLQQTEQKPLSQSEQISSEHQAQLNAQPQTSEIQIVIRKTMQYPKRQGRARQNKNKDENKDNKIETVKVEKEKETIANRKKTPLKQRKLIRDEREEKQLADIRKKRAQEQSEKQAQVKDKAQEQIQDQAKDQMQVKDKAQGQVHDQAKDQAQVKDQDQAKLSSVGKKIPSAPAATLVSQVAVPIRPIAELPKGKPEIKPKSANQGGIALFTVNIKRKSKELGSAVADLNQGEELDAEQEEQASSAKALFEMDASVDVKDESTALFQTSKNMTYAKGRENARVGLALGEATARMNEIKSYQSKFLGDKDFEVFQEKYSTSLFQELTKIMNEKKNLDELVSYVSFITRGVHQECKADNGLDSDKSNALKIKLMALEKLQAIISSMQVLEKHHSRYTKAQFSKQLATLDAILRQQGTPISPEELYNFKESLTAVAEHHLMKKNYYHPKNIGYAAFDTTKPELDLSQHRFSSVRSIKVEHTDAGKDVKLSFSYNRSKMLDGWHSVKTYQLNKMQDQVRDALLIAINEYDKGSEKSPININYKPKELKQPEAALALLVALKERAIIQGKQFYVFDPNTHKRVVITPKASCSEEEKACFTHFAEEKPAHKGKIRNKTAGEILGVDPENLQATFQPIVDAQKSQSTMDKIGHQYSNKGGFRI
ncbi:MAG: hypothetical protein JSS07_03440 [Proteobacteria bacterium]|nr:hypothetical protein [Pseudomonadota bacterium]